MCPTLNFLMKVTKLTTEQQLVDLLKECYPNLPGIVVRVFLLAGRHDLQRAVFEPIKEIVVGTEKLI